MLTLAVLGLTIAGLYKNLPSGVWSAVIGIVGMEQVSNFEIITETRRKKMKKSFSMLIALLVLSMLASGCSRNFVAANKDMGIAPGKKPVYGIATAYFFLCQKEGLPINNFVTEDFAKFVNKNGGNVKPVLKGTSPAIDAALDAYAKEVTDTGKITEKSTFGDLRADFDKLGIDGLIVVYGGAMTPSLGTMLIENAGNVAITTLFGSIGMLPTTPTANFFNGVVSKDGKALYYEYTLFAMIFKRNFGTTSERHKMYDYLYKDIVGKLG